MLSGRLWNELILKRASGKTFPYNQGPGLVQTRISHAPNRIREHGKHSHGYNLTDFFSPYGKFVMKTEVGMANEEDSEHLDKIVI